MSGARGARLPRRRGRAAARVMLVAAGALAAQAALRGLDAAAGAGGGGPTANPGGARTGSAGRWARTNFRGATVRLTGGPALAGAAAVTAAAGAPGPAAAAAALTAGLGAGGFGLYDDLVGARPQHRGKGFHGHLAALRRGRITSGVVKIAGVGAAGLAAAALLEAGRSQARGPTGPPGRGTGPARVVLGGAVISGAANLANLLDLRPGRALKVGLLVGAPLTGGRAGGLAAGPVGAAVGMLGSDLDERTMLGDCGANALGALLGTALAARTGPAGRAVALAVIAGLTATSERVSFTRVIARTPGLRHLDELGRRREGGPEEPASAPGG